jgi:NADH-quinone oxidoreductase subunit F
VVNNVETLVNVPHIVTDGADAYAAVGVPGSTGPKLFCLSGAVARPGVYEVPFGATIGGLLDLAGGVVGDLVSVLVGGAAGSFVGPDRLDTPLTFDASRETGIGVGSGVVMPVVADADLPAVLRRIAAFFRDESCGQCVPCRVGTVRQEEALHRITAGGSVQAELAVLADLDRVMRDASICGLGHTAGSAVQSAIRIGMLGGAA